MFSNVMINIYTISGHTVGCFLKFPKIFYAVAYFINNTKLLYSNTFVYGEI